MCFQDMTGHLKKWMRLQINTLPIDATNNTLIKIDKSETFKNKPVLGFNICIKYNQINSWFFLCPQPMLSSGISTQIIYSYSSSYNNMFIVSQYGGSTDSYNLQHYNIFSSNTTLYLLVLSFDFSSTFSSYYIFFLPSFSIEPFSITFITECILLYILTSTTSRFIWCNLHYFMLLNIFGFFLLFTAFNFIAF